MKRYLQGLAISLFLVLTAITPGLTATALPTKFSSVEATNIIHRVDTIAALRLFAGNSGKQAVQVMGYYAVGDGGGGPVRRWDAASTCTDDGSACIDPTVVSGAGRWVYNNNIVDVVDWGGKYDVGDDATNVAVTATANAVALKKAILYASGGGVVNVTGLLYVGTTAASGLISLVDIDGSDYTLTGGGTIRAMSGVRNPGAGRNLSGWILLDATNLNRVKIFNITIDGNGANNLAWQASSIMTTLVWEKGDDIDISATFLNCSGRNVISSGWGDLAAASKRIRLHDSTFRNFGGAIPGNEVQNDHSAIYAVWEDSSITNNLFTNDNETFTSSGYDVCAIEEHLRNGVISGNTIRNVGHGIISAPLEASVLDSKPKTISHNSITKARKYGIFSSYSQNSVIITGNAIEMIADTTLYTTECVAIRFDFGNKVIISDNHLTVKKSGTSPTFFGGVYIYSPNAQAIYGDLVDFKISGNTITDFKYGVYMYAGGHTHSGFDVTENRITDCEYAVLFNADAPAVISDVLISHNKIRSFNYNYAYSLRSGAAGDLSNVKIVGNEVDVAAVPANYASVTGTINNLQILPIMGTTTTAADPTSGVYSAGKNIIYHTDPAAGGTVGKVPTNSGGGYSSIWAATTAYKKGVWVKTAANKIMECITSGTSSLTDPTSTVLGATVADGTVVWRYRAAGAATFKTFGAIAP